MKPSRGAPRASGPMGRRRARELVMQGLYQWSLSGNPVDEIRVATTERDDFGSADAAYFGELWDGVTRERDALAARLAPVLDRPFAEVSPIERSVLLVGAWELVHRLEIPYRVAINEAVELAKAFGGTDGHKFVNGVLDRLAANARAAEVEQRKSRRPVP